MGDEARQAREGADGVTAHGHPEETIDWLSMTDRSSNYSADVP
jgi:hypothetical protein